MISGHPKSIGILRVDGLSTGPPDLGCHSDIPLMLLYRDREFSVIKELISSKKKKIQNFDPREMGCHMCSSNSLIMIFHTN